MANEVPGSDASETLNGTTGDDLFTPLGGDDVCFGGLGSDTAVLTGTSYDYSISISKSIVNGVYSFIVRTTDQRSGSPDGSDEFRFVEFLQFSNGIQDVDTGANTHLNSRPTGLSLSTTMLLENSSFDAAFAIFSAIDPEGSAVTYALTDDAGGKFRLEGNNLFATQSFDREEQSTYQITLSATDDIGLVASKSLTISIGNVNEMPFLNDDTATISEHEIGRIAVLANDGDSDGNTLSISNAVVASGWGKVTINDDGTLSISYAGKNIEGDQTAMIEISYTATDGSLSATGSVSVVVNGDDYDPGDDIRGTAAANTLNGSDVQEHIYGLGGNDTILANAGNDVLDGGKGNDALTGGKGADTFAFGTSCGKDTVIDFDASGHGHDLIDLSSLKGVETFKDVKALIEDHGRDIWIDAGKDILVIKHIEIRDLSAGDFYF